MILGTFNAKCTEVLIDDKEGKKTFAFCMEFVDGDNFGQTITVYDFFYGSNEIKAAKNKKRCMQDLQKLGWTPGEEGFDAIYDAEVVVPVTLFEEADLENVLRIRGRFGGGGGAAVKNPLSLVEQQAFMASMRAEFLSLTGGASGLAKAPANSTQKQKVAI